MTQLSWIESYGDDNYLGYDLSKLKRDDCYVTINNTGDKDAYLFYLYEECMSCPYTISEHILPNTIKKLQLSTKHKQMYRILNESIAYAREESLDNIICKIDTSFGEFGIYNILVSDTNCAIDIIKEPVSIYFPLITVFLIYALLFSLIPIGKFIWNKMKISRLDTYPISKEIADTEQSSTQRLKSLDSFRGICIVLMIFTNYGAGGYPFLEHAIWNGLNVGDLVFPWFMWIMGVCIPISMNSSLNKGMSRSKAIRNVLRRSCILFGLGLFLGATPYLNNLQLNGVLQRFGVCYFFVATLCLAPMSEAQLEEKKGPQRHIKDILVIKFQWIIILIILSIYCVILHIFEEPGCATGYFGPGGMHMSSLNFNCSSGENIYEYPTDKTIYQSMAFDPERILGYLPNIFQVFLGVQAGTTILQFKGHSCRLKRWLVWAIITGVIAGALCGFSKEGGIIPVNKKDWSISFALVTSSFAFILLSICYFVIEVKKIWSGKPFIFAGMNAIIIYVGHEMTYSNFPFHWYLSNYDVNRTHFMFMIDNVWATSLWVLVAYYLYKIKFFLSI